MASWPGRVRDLTEARAGNCWEGVQPERLLTSRNLPYIALTELCVGVSANRRLSAKLGRRKVYNNKHNQMKKAEHRVDLCGPN